jgi:hypothetical protein
MHASAGARLASTVCETEVIVIRAPADQLELECGGATMVAAGSPEAHGGELQPPGDGEGTLVGKRYVDAGRGLEVLCTKSGHGILRVGGSPLTIRPPANLPSSD